jgi:hypothetical protein
MPALRPRQLVPSGASGAPPGSSRGPEHSVEPPAGYEPPRVERVLTPAELEREVLYAGTAATPGSV